ncbi:MAG: sigma-70 family RNA polymerase sigma factor [Candidatus Nanopelagicales bacterium]
MLVQLLHRMHPDDPPCTTQLVRSAARCLRSAGVEVWVDLVAEDTVSAEHPDEAMSLVSRGWRGRGQPDLIHAFGGPAAGLAYQAGLASLMTVSFPADPVGSPSAEFLARQAAGVIALSSAEHRYWLRLGVAAMWAGPLPISLPVPDAGACADPTGHVVALACGPDLDELLASMRYWSARLVVAAPLSTSRRAHIETLVAQLGLANRVRLLPGASGPQRARMWRAAALVYAGAEDSQLASAVREGALHGVPALARESGGNGDMIVSGINGLLMAADGSWNLGHTVATMLAEPFWIRAMGTAALARQLSDHVPEGAGTRLSQLYARVLGGAPTGEQMRWDGAPVPAPNDQADLAEAHLPLAQQLAGWYRGRGQSQDDLLQVACLGLVHAAQRFDPSHGREFPSFAIPTILGELRRHFRDNAWAVHVPRGLQETTLQVRRTADNLHQRLGRVPTSLEVAAELGLPDEAVRLALRTDGEAWHPHSLDHPLDADTFASLVGDLDPEMEAADLRHDVRAAIAQLPEREQRILLLRFFGERTQSEIAELMGISQVHVSRVLSRTLTALREHVLNDVPLPTPRASK